MDMGVGTGQIFIQRVGYEGGTTRTLPAPLTSLLIPLNYYLHICNFLYDHPTLSVLFECKTSYMEAPNNFGGGLKLDGEFLFTL